MAGGSDRIVAMAERVQSRPARDLEQRVRTHRLDPEAARGGAVRGGPTGGGGLNWHKVVEYSYAESLTWLPRSMACIQKIGQSS